MGLRRAVQITVAVFAACSTAHALADATWERAQAREQLNVGVMLSGGPFGALDPSTQQPVGLNVDLARELGQRLGLKVELVPVLPANRVQFLQQGKVDLLIANMEWNPERDAQLGHVQTPFYKVGGTAALPPSSPIKAWADLAGKPVCTSQGSSYIKPLTEIGADIKAFKSSSESLLALRGNNCLAAVHDATLVKPLLASNPDWQGYTALAPELNPAPSVIWTRPGETDTQAKLDPIVKDLHRSGWLVQAEQRNHIEPMAADQFGL